MIKGKTIFITGGGGFIGSHLCEKLVEDNKIVVLDNEHRNALKHTSLLSHPNLKYIKGDILDSNLPELMKGSDIVIHCAAIAGIDTVIKKPIVTMKVNFLGTHNALEGAIKNNVERFIDFSTSEVYGPVVYKADEASLTMQGRVGEMRWTYAAAKLAAEHLAFSYSEEYGLPIVIIRPFNIYGPRQVGEGAMHKFIANAIENKDITIYGDGTQTRSWCYIDDFVDGVLRCAKNPKAINKIFNIGNPEGTVSILQLAKEIIRVSGSKSKILFEESSAPDVEMRIPSIKHIKEVLDFEPKVDLSEGIQKTITWYSEHKSALN